MIRTLLAAAVAFVLCPAAHADVTIKATATGKGLGMTGTTQSVTYIKGLKMRSEAVSGMGGNTTIFDVDAQKMYLLDDEKKTAEVWDMGAFAQEMSQTVAVENVQASMTPNGQTRTVNGQAADGYDVKITVPATIGGAGGMPMTILLEGVSWIAKGVPGSEDYAAFYKGAAEKGWIFSDPRAAKGQPGQAKAMAQMYTEFSKIGGLPLETQMDIKAKGEGMMAAMMARMGGVSIATTTDSVETAPLDDSLFQVPAEYRLEQQ